MVDYFLHSNGEYSLSDERSVNTKNVGLVLDNEFNVLQSTNFINRTGPRT